MSCALLTHPLTHTENNGVEGAEVSPPLPFNSLFCSFLPPPLPWHYCCIAADVISCFLSRISAFSPRLTFSPLLNGCRLWAQHHCTSASIFMRLLHTVVMYLLQVSVFPPPSAMFLFSSLPLTPLCVFCANCAVLFLSPVVVARAEECIWRSYPSCPWATWDAGKREMLYILTLCATSLMTALILSFLYPLSLLSSLLLSSLYLFTCAAFLT